MKLHDLKTWFARNHWLAFLLCEHFYTLLTNSQEKFQDQNSDSLNESKQAKEVIAKLDNLYLEKDKPTPSEVEKILEEFPKIPFLFDDTNGKYMQQMSKYQQIIYR